MRTISLADAVALIPDGAMSFGLIRGGHVDMAVIAFPGGRATLMETAPGVSVQQVRDATEAELVVPAQVPQMAL